MTTDLAIDPTYDGGTLLGILQGQPGRLLLPEVGQLVRCAVGASEPAQNGPISYFS